MAVNEIIIGDREAPILSFENDAIISINEVSSVSMVGAELSIDQLTPVVRYKVLIKQAFVPSNYSGFRTADGLKLYGKYNYDLRKLPYGTKISFISDNQPVGEYFCESVEREGMERYLINAVSVIGLMDKQISKGGIYDGQLFGDVLKSIIGDEYRYTINEDVAALQIFGWLPYSTRRKNLHQLLIANGVNIVRQSTAELIFTFLANVTPEDIPAARVYDEGRVKYGDAASRVEVTEHTYHYLINVEEVTLFDNTRTDPVENTLVTFDMPVYPSSLRVTEGDLIILSSHVNYVTVSGTGVLVGKPYTHTTRILSKNNSGTHIEKVVRVEDATLVTLVNAENVLERVAQYYFNATQTESSIVHELERCGRRYKMQNAFRESITGFMTRMEVNMSAIRKAECEFIVGYEPKAYGSTYTNAVILPEASGVWTIPPEVFDKGVKNIRVVLIGSGEAGGDGGNGGDGEKATITDATLDDTGTTVISPPSGIPGAGGAGGLGGAGGAGGKVYSATLDCTGLTSFEYGRNGLDTYFRGGKYSISSASGLTSDTGFLEIFSGVVYALPGYAGQDGGSGGKGGIYPPSGTAKDAQSGEDVIYAGTTYKGGAGAVKGKTAVLPSAADIETGVQLFFGGGGGGGAAVNANGAPGVLGTAKIDKWYGIISVLSGINTYDDGGAGANGATGNPPPALYGTGGNGGNGGGGGGGAGVAAYYNETYSTWVSALSGSGGKGGKGGAGSSGSQGCAIIYY